MQTVIYYSQKPNPSTFTSETFPSRAKTNSILKDFIRTSRILSRSKDKGTWIYKTKNPSSNKIDSLSPKVANLL